jgi:hypothetical protein
MGILAGLIVLGLGWRLWRLLTRRGHRPEVTGRTEAQHGPSETQPPIPDLPGYAAAHGWSGPTEDLGDEPAASAYVEGMLRNISGVSGSTDVQVGGPRYANVYRGRVGDRAFAIGNVWIGVGGTDRPGSVCVLHLGEVLPPLFVNLRDRQAFLRLGMKEMTFESEAFDRRFRVMALDREYAMDVISAQTMQLLLERDDWVFFLEFDRLVCLAASTFAALEDVTGRLQAVGRFADLIPRFVEQDRAAHMPTLPDGTAFDPQDPASMERFKQALLAMSPAQRQAFLAEVRVEGARFLAGMFGKELPPEILRRLEAEPIRDVGPGDRPPG